MKLRCDLDEQQCRDSCEHKGHRQDCPHVTTNQGEAGGKNYLQRLEEEFNRVRGVALKHVEDHGKEVIALNIEILSLKQQLKEKDKQIQELKDHLSDMKGFFADNNTPL